MWCLEIIQSPTSPTTKRKSRCDVAIWSPKKYLSPTSPTTKRKSRCGDLKSEKISKSNKPNNETPNHETRVESFSKSNDATRQMVAGLCVGIGFDVGCLDLEFFADFELFWRFRCWVFGLSFFLVLRCWVFGLRILCGLWIILAVSLLGVWT
jgi:hypothetical protein